MVEIVAEISGNHGGDLNKAEELIHSAAWAGCDYAKFQYYRPTDMPDYLEHSEMYEKLCIPDDWLPRLFEAAKDCSIGLFASVFSVRAAKELLKYDVPYIKIASPDSTLLGDDAVRDICNVVPADVEIIWSSREMNPGKTLYCPLGHPPVITTADFKAFRRGNFWGFSDHTSGIRTPLAFVRAGAQMVEKHLKLNDDCVDAAFSADALTMQTLCNLAHNQ